MEGKVCQDMLELVITLASVREYLVVHVFPAGFYPFHLFHAVVPLATCMMDDPPMVGNSLLPSLHMNFAILRVANATLVER